MASIRKNDSGNFRADIRKKGSKNVSASFSNKETAELWAAYKEDLIDQIKKFEVPLEDMINLETAIDMKVENMVNENFDKKSIGDVEILKNTFSEFLDRSLVSISYDELFKKMGTMLNTIVKKGGHGEKGDKRVQSPLTVLKKFGCLSSVYSMLISNGMNLENHALKIMAILRKMSKKGN